MGVLSSFLPYFSELLDSLFYSIILRTVELFELEREMYEELP
jgi:hypothetical protein